MASIPPFIALNRRVYMMSCIVAVPCSKLHSNILYMPCHSPHGIQLAFTTYSKIHNYMNRIAKLTERSRQRPSSVHPKPTMVGNNPWLYEVLPHYRWAVKTVEIDIFTLEHGVELCNVLGGRWGRVHQQRDYPGLKDWGRQNWLHILLILIGIII